MTSKTQLVQTHIVEKIQWQVYHPNTRIPSVRDMANKLSVSPYTVSQAYDNLVAKGYIYARQGAGYFVREPKQTQPSQAVTLPSMTNNVLDTGWLLTHLFNDLPRTRASGSGLLPNDWLMPKKYMLSASRKVINELDYVYEYGHLQGYSGLREQFARQLDDMGISAHPSMMLTTTGVSAGIVTIVQAMCQAGDTIVVDDPTWFWIIGSLQNLGMNVIGVTRTHDGVDLAQFETILQHYQPKLYITNSVLHNPTSYTVTPTNVFAVLQLMEKYDCYIVEDDVYSAFHPDKNMVRYATLDGFKRVFYLNGVSKVLGGNWRIGLMVCPEMHLQNVLRQKMLSNMTCPEMTERAITYIWQDPAFAKHEKRIQGRLAKAHHNLIRRLKKHGFTPPADSNPCLFMWLNLSVENNSELASQTMNSIDTAELALQAHKDGWLVAPGHLFSPTGRFKSHIRLNITRTSDEFLEWLRAYMH